jgi:hypothetical protein
MPGSKLIVCLLNSTDFNIYLLALGEGTVEYKVLLVMPFTGDKQETAINIVQLQQRLVPKWIL